MGNTIIIVYNKDFQVTTSQEQEGVKIINSQKIHYKIKHVNKVTEIFILQVALPRRDEY